MHLRAVHAARRSHVRHYPQKFAALKDSQCLSTGVRRYHRIAAAFEHGTHVCHHSRFVLNQQHRGNGRIGYGLIHRCKTPAATPIDALSAAAGKRTTNVAPSEPALLWEMISPPCSRTMP